MPESCYKNGRQLRATQYRRIHIVRFPYSKSLPFFGLEIVAVSIAPWADFSRLRARGGG